MRILSETGTIPWRRRSIAIVLSLLMIGSIVAPFAAGASPTQVAQPSVDEPTSLLAIDANDSSDESTSVEEPTGDSESAATEGPSQYRLAHTVGAERDGFPLVGTDQTIVSTDESVIALNETSNGDALEAYARDGDLEWERQLFGSGDGPVLQDGVLYVLDRRGSANDPSNVVRAIDPTTGEETWNSADAAPSLDPAWGTPVVDEHVYVENSSDEIAAIDPDDGTVVWSATPRFDSLSTAAEGNVYLERDDQLMALNGTTGETRWDWYHWNLSNDVAATPVVDDGALYVSTGQYSSQTSRLYAIDAETGVAEWRIPFDDTVSEVAVAGGESVYVASGHTVFALDMDGEIQASYRTDGDVTDLHYDGTLYAGSEDGLLYAFDDGLSVEWKHELPAVAHTPPDYDAWPTAVTAVGDTVVATGSAESSYWGGGGADAMYVFEPTDGSVTDVDAQTSATVGETVPVTATVTNGASETVEYDVTFEIESPLRPPNDPETRTETVQIRSESTATVETDLAVSTRGEYRVTAFEAGTSGTVPGAAVRPEPTSIEVTPAGADDLDWGQHHQSATGWNANPNTTTPTRPLEPIWNTEENPDFEYGGKTDHAANGLVVEGDLVIAHNDTTFFALDLQTGEEVWNRTISFPEQYDGDDVAGEALDGFAVSNGTLYLLAGFQTWDNTIYQTSHTRLYAVDATDGSDAWDRNGATYRQFYDRDIETYDGELIVTGQRIVFPAENTDDDSEFEGDMYVHGVDRADGDSHQTVRIPDVRQPGPANVIDLRANGETVLFKTESDDTRTYRLHSHDAVTLVENDVRDFGGGYEGFRHVVDDEAVYVVNNTGSEEGASQSYALDPENLTDEQWVTTTDQASSVLDVIETDSSEDHRSLALSDGHLLTTTRYYGEYDTRGVHYSIDPETGDVQWIVEAKLDAQPLIGEGVFFSSNGIRDLADGSEIAVNPDRALNSDSPLELGQPIALANGTVLNAVSGQTGNGIEAYHEGGGLEVSEVSLSADELTFGDTLEADVTVTNPHEVDREFTIYQGGVSLDSPSGGSLFEGTVEAGESKTVTFERQVGDESGELDGGDYAVSMRVVETTQQTTTPSQTAYQVRVPDSKSVTVTEVDSDPERPGGVMFADVHVHEDVVRVGENLTTTVTVTNVGDEETDFGIEAELSDFLESASQTVTVAPDEEATVELTLAQEWGYWNDSPVTVNGWEVHTVDFVDDDVRITNATLAETTVEAGDTANVTVTLENEGNTASDDTLTITADGTVLESEPVDVSPGESRQLTIPTTFHDGGDVDVVANVSDHGYGGTYEVAVGTVTVNESDSSVADYAGADDVVRTDGLRNAIDDWRDDDVDTDLLRAVIDAWRNGEPIV